MTSNQIALRQVRELERHNLATEQEDRRHNVVTEGYTAEHYARSDEAALRQSWASASQAETAKANSAINAINAETTRYAAETSRLSYYEAERHNIASETETQRHNQAQEKETVRHNQASEDIDTVKANAALTQAYASSSQALTAAGQLASYSALITAEVANYGARTLEIMTNASANADYTKAKTQQVYSDIGYASQKQQNETAWTQQQIRESQAKVQSMAANTAIAQTNANTQAYTANLKGLEFKEKYGKSPDTSGQSWIRKAVDKLDDTINGIINFAY